MTSLELLRALSNAFGPSGFEDDVRDMIKTRLKDEATFSFDRNGSIIARRKTGKKGPKVMLAAHMDEIGLIVQHITPEGFIRFHPIGGWWEHTLLAQKVVIRTRDGEITGIIGAKPKHHLSAADKDKVMPISNMFIDVGATDRKQVTEELGIRLGDPIVPKTEFATMKNKHMLSGKAFDNRVGVALMIETMVQTMKDKLNVDLYGVGTVQEEVGIRGAETSSDVVNPDLAFVLEGPPGDDTVGFSRDESQCAVGKGPQLRLFDPTAITNKRLAEWVLDAANELNIPHQIAVRTSGGTDAHAIHLHHTGVPTIVIGVPVRYAHSHVGLMDMHDYSHSLKLIVELVRRLDAKTVESFTAY